MIGAMMQNTIEREIESLSDTEAQCTKKLEVYEETDREWNKITNFSSRKNLPNKI
jgi:hypothetical protein